MINTTTFAHLEDTDPVEVGHALATGSVRIEFGDNHQGASVTVFVPVATAQELARAILRRYPLDSDGRPGDALSATFYGRGVPVPATGCPHGYAQGCYECTEGRK